MPSEWDKLNDPVQQELERREMMQRVHGRAPLGRILGPLLYWAAVIIVGVVIAKYFL
jgi:hypothetical protein